MMVSKARIFIRNSPFYSRLLSDGIWALVSRLVISFFGLVISGLITRLLSPSEVGDYAYVLSLVVPAAILAQLGLGATSVREIASSISKNKLQAVRETVFQTLLWGIIGVVLAASLLLLLRKNLGLRSDVIPLIIIWIAIISITQLFGGMMRGFHNIRASVLISGSTYGGIITHLVIVSLLVFALLTIGNLSLPDLITLMLIGGGSSIILGFILLWKVIQKYSSKEKRFNIHVNFRFVRMSLPILVSMIADILWSQSAIWILAAYTASETLALYDSARRLVLLVRLTLTIANVVLPPIIAQLYTEGDLEGLEQLLRRSATVVGLPALLGLVVITFMGESILGFVYGDYYRAGGTILLILSIGNTLQVLTGSCGAVLNMTGKQNALMKVMVISSFITISIAALIAPRWGVTGVAITMSAGVAFQNIAKMILARHLVGVWTFVGI